MKLVLSNRGIPELLNFLSKDFKLTPWGRLQNKDGKAESITRASNGEFYKKDLNF